jgi:predicted DNA-binding transcriptional regulator YafY
VSESAETIDGEAWDLLTLHSPLDALADEVLTYGPDVVVRSPGELRDAVVARLRAVVEGGTR